MATQQTKGALAGFLPEVTPEAAEANRRYIEAQQKLAETLDVRKNRTFDPMWLAAAQAFLAPTKTGSSFETFGNVAGKLGEVQEREQELAKSIASQELELAGAGLNLERMRQRDKAFQQIVNRQDPTQTRFATGQEGALPGVSTSGGAPGAVPGAALPPSVVRKPTAPPAGGALPASGQRPAQARPAGLEGLPGAQIAPPNPEFMSGQDYLNLARFDSNVDIAAALQKANEMERNRFDVKDSGVFDRSTGMYYQFPKGQEEIEIAYTRQSIKMPAQDAFRLNNAWANRDFDTYWSIASAYGVKKPEGAPGGPAPTTGGALPGRAPAAGAPAARAPAAPAGSPFRSTSEAETEREEAKTTATKRAEVGVKKEEQLESDLATADKIGFITTQAMEQINTAPDLLGILNKPGIGSAIGKLVTEGVKIGQTSIGIPAVEDAIRGLLKGADQEKLNAVASLAGNLAELELLYTQLYIKGQGAVTEGERAVVRRIPGTLSTNPNVLKEKMTLLQKRSDFDRKRIEAFQDYMEQNPRGNYLKFTRSDEFKRIREEYNDDLYRTFNLKKPGQTSSAPSAPSAPATPRAPAAPSAPAAGGSFAKEIERAANQRRAAAAKQGGGQ
jgi:hypothetical protein